MRPGLLLLPGLVLAMGGCVDPAAGSNAGALEVVLHSSRPDDGAVLLSVDGGPIDSIGSAGYRLYSARFRGQLRVIVSGDLRPGPIARLWIPDGRLRQAYAAMVRQVAGRDYSLREPGGYQLELR